MADKPVKTIEETEKELAAQKSEEAERHKRRHRLIGMRHRAAVEREKPYWERK